MWTNFLQNYEEYLERKFTFLGRDLPKATAGVEQNSPMFTPGVANWDFSLATAMSQLATSWQPAAVAKPFTLAITGTGSFWIKVITCMHKRGVSMEIQDDTILFWKPSKLPSSLSTKNPPNSWILAPFWLRWWRACGFHTWLLQHSLNMGLAMS